MIYIFPARSFIKCCKGHGGFYECERCVIKRSTINKKRVYSKTDCELRTKESYITKKQIEHHTVNVTSPLIRIPNFDPVCQVFLDPMYALISFGRNEDDIYKSYR